MKTSMQTLSNASSPPSRPARGLDAAWSSRPDRSLIMTNCRKIAAEFVDVGVLPWSEAAIDGPRAHVGQLQTPTRTANVISDVNGNPPRHAPALTIPSKESAFVPSSPQATHNQLRPQPPAAAGQAINAQQPVHITTSIKIPKAMRLQQTGVADQHRPAAPPAPGPPAPAISQCPVQPAPMQHINALAAQVVVAQQHAHSHTQTSNLHNPYMRCHKPQAPQSPQGLQQALDLQATVNTMAGAMTGTSAVHLSSTPTIQALYYPPYLQTVSGAQVLPMALLSMNTNPQLSCSYPLSPPMAPASMGAVLQFPCSQGVYAPQPNQHLQSDCNSPCTGGAGCIMQCGITINGVHQVRQYTPLFGKDVAIFTCCADPVRTPLYKGSDLAAAAGVSTPRVSMYLLRRRKRTSSRLHCSQTGIHQAARFVNRVHGIFVKRQEYLVREDICIEFLQTCKKP